MRKKYLLKTSLLTIAMGAVFGQTPAPEKAVFEVASIKPAEPQVPGKPYFMGSSGGPGTKDPGIFQCHNCNLPMLIAQAYDIKFFQLTYPKWMDDTRFEINAKLPTGATKAQFRLMLQDLLVERFKLALHHDAKEMQVYDLVVAKGGPKFAEHVDKKEEAEDAAAPARGGARGPNVDADGYPIIAKGCKGCIMIVGSGKARMSMQDSTMKEFADMVASQVNKIVYDATGLKGKYDISLTYQMQMGVMRGGPGGPPPPPPSNSAGPLDSDSDMGIPLVGAIQPQLGLRLESKKGSVDMLVIDHAEKAPTEN
jgi:uncharacterized protein (TIGR03435 family)